MTHIKGICNRKSLIQLGLVMLCALLVTTGCDMQRLIRISKAASMFDKDEIVHNFTHMKDIFTRSEVPKADVPVPLDYASLQASLPRTLSVEGAFMDTQYFLDYTGTTGLLVIKDGVVLYENYWRGHHANQQHISWSLAKSMISALIGVAISEGYITNVNDPVDQYAPQLKDTAYNDVPLKHVLQMSSGVGFNEDYDDDNADVVQLARIAAVGGSFNAYAKKLKREHEPGTFNHYSSFDTQVLAMVLQGATQRSLSDYMAEKLWQPLGTENNGYWITDSQGMEMAFGGFNATLRDYARFGLLYLNQGQWNGKQLVPTDWIKESLSMDGSHLLPDNTERESFLGYGYQWWIPDNPQRDYMAIGVYSQFIYVSPKKNVVIVKNSANHRYVTAFDDFVTTYLHLALFRSIANSLANNQEQNQTNQRHE